VAKRVCGKFMSRINAVCARGFGHIGDCRDEANLERRRAKEHQWWIANSDLGRERSRRWQASNRDYFRQWEKEHPEYARERNRKRRERKANSGIFYSTGLLKWDLEDGRCYICLGPLGNNPHRDHVIALAEPQPENVTISALRMACAPCNISRRNKPLAEFMLGMIGKRKIGEALNG
jgi:5-methylcytosine-specific restriction endonuclease McrA